MTNIGAINSKHTKKLWCHKNSKIVTKICDTLLPNGMLCHYHMKHRVIINRKGQQYFELAKK
jgi:hypothetical protein